ncbi:MAG TPA: quinone-dependent dihydroorotate dehydrogenase [Xanthobacteraceae bacterium]|jgi:dihydroorotate dehydrogenase|nr:quinone-dependent dihydroorotate dehydrogenase [Xanthobacteraceae bacterium]
MSLYSLVRPALHLLEPETAHHLAILALRSGLVPRTTAADDPVLATRVFDLAFPNPIGLAAGFDKNAEIIDAVLRLGFGFTEAGTVTPLPQPGNAGKRLFRLDEDEAVINRFGFNSEGLAPYVERLRARKRSGIVGANVGKNRNTVDGAADYVKGIEAVCGLADYLVVNLSSPNTPGLRGLQARAPIQDLLARVMDARRRSLPDAQRLPPLLAKVGPDLDDDALRDIAEVVTQAGIDGLIVGNTTIERPPTLRSRDRNAEGGLSGKPLLAHATACLSKMYALTQGRIPIIGCGGVTSGADAYAKIRAGASLVQFYSAIVFHGPTLVVDIKRELAALLRADGFASVADAVGADHRR